MSESKSRGGILVLTAQIVSAHVANNAVPTSNLPGLIEQVYQALSMTDVGTPEPVALVPAVPIKRSVFPDHIVCLEDGEKLRLLKRHLATVHNLTPEQYRQRWKLPDSYPLIAPDYADHRSKLAQQLGFGRKRDVAETAAIAQAGDSNPQGQATPSAKPVRRSRKVTAP